MHMQLLALEVAVAVIIISGSSLFFPSQHACLARDSLETRSAFSSAPLTAGAVGPLAIFSLFNYCSRCFAQKSPTSCEKFSLVAEIEIITFDYFLLRCGSHRQIVGWLEQFWFRLSGSGIASLGHAPLKPTLNAPENMAH